ncbi:MAG: SDR family oxidoreductase [Candidatus Tectomicrobia bacterium]|uniref:SDR family oxidoreductase n=1 Tax=Tectimicrobiota bacterium TaxID=2528274 RepID=A0A932HYV9_UNCTE|nr:SDR family oxidoreductase [Candidatus Tectomicrobia bacterium]
MFSLRGKTALVTGSARGIGHAIARAFAAAGADVVLHGRDGVRLKRAAESIPPGGGRIALAESDLSREEGILDLCRKAEPAFGRIDILVNNAAARGTLGPLLDCPLESWQATMRANVSGYLQMIQMLARPMAGRGWGRVINVVSSTGLKARAGYGDYSISKAAQIMMTRQFASELGRYGITVNAIAPILTRTDFSAATWQNEEKLQRVLSLQPIPRLLEAEDCAGAAVFLASEASSMVTGTVLPVDGGALA